MAAYLELLEVARDSDFQDKLLVAVVVAAYKVTTDIAPPPNQVARLAWAAKVMRDPSHESEAMQRVVLASNRDFDQSVILAASDSVIQSAVDTAVDLFADNA